MSIDERRLSFGPAADLYDRVRPTYPAEAVRFALGGDGPRRVVDLGAGTGIFTRLLLALGHDVVAVEPDAGMRRKLAERTQGVEVLAGSAEAIPVLDESVDAVTAAQAHHWFEPERAHREIARVLRRGGVFAAVWNVRDESVAWVAQLSELAGLEGNSSAPRPCNANEFGLCFAKSERAEFPHAVELDADSLLGLIRSRSQYLVANEAERRRVDTAVANIAADLPQRFELPYLTRVVRARSR